MNYSKFISDAAARRNLSVLAKRRLMKKPANALSLIGGIPNPSTFPFLEASFTLQDGRTLNIDPHLMATGLQYGETAGYQPLLEQLKDLIERFHAPPRMSESDVVVTYGSQHGLSMSCELLLNPGDYVVLEEPSYCAVFPMVRRLQARFLPIQCDRQGMDPVLLRAALAQCTDGVVKFMYLNPSGTNPSGLSMGETRRREIYKIACEHDLIILEDDPYYFIQFIEKRPPSFLSLDTEGRVLRFDSFSKIVSAGLRVGYVTGPKPFTDKLRMNVMESVIVCTLLSQVIVSELLRTWGHEGFMQQVRNVCQLYRTRRDAMLEVADRHLTGVCEWMAPEGGMFFWVKVLGVKDTRRLVQERAMKRAVLFAPGFGFMPDESQACPYIRVSYSTATPEQMDKAFKILTEIIEEEKLDSKTP